MSEQQARFHETYGLEGALEGVDARREARRVHHQHDEGSKPEEGSNDHLASIYESAEAQFEAVVPFIEDGLARGERCLYVADDNSKPAVLAALREGGVDVEAARETGALSIHTAADTYHRTGEFEQAAMLDFWQEALTEARDERGFTGVRAAAEMTWALDDDDTGLDQLVEYEAMLNTTYPGDDYVVLCQYNRERFPADVISDVIRTHPLVVYDGTVCRNFYYHPPEEFIGANHPPLDVDRTVEGLVSRARTRSALDERDEQLRSRLAQQEVVAELGQRGLKERGLDGLLADAAERVAETLDADYCAVLERLPDEAELLLRAGVGWRDGLVGEATVSADHDVQAGYALRSAAPVIVDELPSEPRFGGTDLLTAHAVTSGVSVAIGPSDDPWGVLGVHTRDRREFTEHDAAFVRSVANTLGAAVERTERARYLRRLYEITSNPDLPFERKLAALFELGCERFDLELGGIARVDPATDLFEVERVSGDHEHLQPGERYPLSETFCQVATDASGASAVTNPESQGFEGSLCYDAFGARTYLGTHLEVEGDDDRTFWFLSSESREEPFSDAELTFHHLMGQWVRGELQRRQYRKRLEASNERLEQFAHAASHDLQEPLRMVSSYLQFIDRRYADELDAEGREFIDFAVDGAQRMSDMIEGLLDYSRVETQGGPMEPVDLRAVLEDVLTDLQFQIQESGAEITVESLPSVQGDERQLRQVFQNLLENAIQYSGDGPPRVCVAAEREGSMWRVSVTDEGIGIDPANVDRVFEVFQRLHTREEYDGTGIGLAICRRIVERHGGKIRVDSEPGEGSTFHVTLPPLHADDA